MALPDLWAQLAPGGGGGLSWTARGELHHGTAYVMAWPGELPWELEDLVEAAELERAAFLGTATGPTLLPPAPGEDDRGAWLLALLRERTRLHKVTGRPPRWPLPPGACG